MQKRQSASITRRTAHMHQQASFPAYAWSSPHVRCVFGSLRSAVWNTACFAVTANPHSRPTLSDVSYTT